MEKKTIVFQGDSITDAGRSRENDLETGNGYVTLVKEQLEALYPGAYVCYNRGQGGNCIDNLYSRNQRDVIDLKPDYLSILVGVNDVWFSLGGRTRGVSAERYERIYEQMITDILQALPHCKILLMEPFLGHGVTTCNTEEEPDRWERMQAEIPLRAEAARRVAEKYGLPCIALQPLFQAACGNRDMRELIQDGVHPTKEGQQLIARAWMAAFEQMK